MTVGRIWCAFLVFMVDILLLSPILAVLLFLWVRALIKDKKTRKNKKWCKFVKGN